MPLPPIPHSAIEPDCCGCLCEVVEDDGSRFFGNECSTEVFIQDVHRIILEMESTAATCPHCDHINQIHGFSEIYAFTCRHCGRGISPASLEGLAWHDVLLPER